MERRRFSFQICNVRVRGALRTGMKGNKNNSSYIHYCFGLFFEIRKKKPESCVCVRSDVRAEWIYPSALNVCSAALDYCCSKYVPAATFCSWSYVKYVCFAYVFVHAPRAPLPAQTSNVPLVPCFSSFFRSLFPRGHIFCAFVRDWYWDTTNGSKIFLKLQRISHFIEKNLQNDMSWKHCKWIE